MVVDTLLEPRENLKVITTGVDLAKAHLAVTGKKRNNNKLQNIDRIGIPTGYELDYIIGTNMIDPATGEKIREVRGIRDGSMIGLTGPSNTGKSTFGLDLMRVPMAIFKESELYMFDTENGMSNEYMATILKIPQSDLNDRVHYYSSDETSTESMYVVIEGIHKEKMSNSKNYLYDTGVKKADGSKLMKMIPTFIFNDSFSNLRPEQFKGISEKFDPTFHMRRNGVNGVMLGDVKDLLIEANIIFIAIVHEGKVVDTSSYGGPKKAFQALGADTAFGGGKAFKYNCDLILKANKYIKSDSNKLNEEMKTTGLDYVISWDLVKSRFGPANTRCTFYTVKTLIEGFCQLNSIFYSLRFSHKVLTSVGAGYYKLKGLDREKFLFKECKNLFMSDPAFRKQVKVLLNEEWAFMLNGKKTIDEMAAISDAVLSIF